MSNFDKDRYQSLISRCAADFSFYKGHFQDCSKNRIAMTIGAWSCWWTQCNGLPVFNSPVGGLAFSTAALAPLIDYTQPFSVEFCRIGPYSGYLGSTVLRQNNNGGFALYDIANNYYLVTYTNAGVLARRTFASALSDRSSHFVYTLGANAGSTLVWSGGVPVANTFSAGVSANNANQAVLVAHGQRGAFIARIYPFALTNEDVATLYASAKLLTGGEV